MTVEQAIVAIASDDAAERARAAERLAQAADAAQPAGVNLVLASGDDDEVVREWATAALESLGPPRPEDQGPLAELVSDQRLDVAYWAATLLGRLGPDAEASTAALTTALASHRDDAVRQQAAWALAKIGPGAASARDALRQAATEKSPRLARLARAALEAIGD